MLTTFVDNDFKHADFLLRKYIFSDIHWKPCEEFRVFYASINKEMSSFQEIQAVIQEMDQIYLGK